MQTGADTEFVVLEDLDWSPACESRNEEHVGMVAHDATHAITQTCGCTMLVCVQAVTSAHFHDTTDGYVLLCLKCGTNPVYISSVTRLKP